MFLIFVLIPLFIVLALFGCVIGWMLIRRRDSE
jgi:hypothetical protein